VSTVRSKPRDVLLSGALTLADTSDRDARLLGIAAAALQTIGGRKAVVYLQEAETGRLEPAVAIGLEVAAFQPLDSLDEESVDATVLASRERRTQVVVGRRERRAYSALLAGDEKLRGAMHLPLVVESSSSGPEVQGVLALGLEDEPPGERRVEILEALAGLAAVAAHDSRLELALTERSDWFDRLAHTDGLTGLANRRTFDRVLELEMARAARQNTELAVAIFRVDRHGAISAAHGAHVGDNVLRRVAASLADTVRLVDTVARYGHDEFVVVAPGSAGLAMARRVAELVAGVEPVNGDGPVTVTVGVARFPEDGRSAEELLSSAERALRDATTQGTGTILAASGA